MVGLSLSILFAGAFFSMVSCRIPFRQTVLTKKLPQKTLNITIGGIFPMSGSWGGGIGCFPAVLKALEDVNMNSSILPNHYLILHSNDSKCEPGLGTNALFDLIRSPPTKLMILGPGCSTVSTFVAEAAKMWNLVVLSYGSSSPALSNRERFPTFFRTHPSATLENPARIKLIKEFNWTHISIIQQIEEVFTTTAENLETMARQNNVSIVTRQNFLTDPVDAVTNLKNHDARIIIGLFYENMARAVLCAAYKEGLTSSKHVWFLIGWYADNWYKDDSAISLANSTNCTVEEMKSAADGHFTVEPVFLDRFGGSATSGMTANEFLEYIRGEVSPNDPGFVESPLAYDAVWTMALAINSTIESLQRKYLGIEDFSYTNAAVMNELKNAVASSSFQGLSSLVEFTNTGDRIAKILIEQLQNDDYVTVGYYDSKLGQLQTARSGASNLSRQGVVKYHFKTGLPPKDRKLIHFQFWYISLAIMIVVWFMTFLHGCFAVTYIVAANALADHYVFGASVPWLNAIVLLGCVTANLGVCIWGLANSSLTEGFGGWIFLHTGAFLQSVGFTLTVGGMFLKTSMLRRIVPRASTPKDPVTGKASVPSPPLTVLWYEKLVAIICIAFDLVLHLTWPFVDPISMETKELPDEELPDEQDSDIFIRPRLFVYNCIYMTMWLALCLGQKGVLLLAASFLSFDTRNMKHRQINDSKFISLSVYNIAVFSLITVSLTLLIKEKPTASFSFISGAVLLCTWISLALISVPKIFALSRRQKGGALGDKKSSDISFRGLGSRLFGRRKNANKMTSESGRSGEGGADATEEDFKLRKLMAENEEIKRLISEKEIRISELRELLLARLQGELLRSSNKTDGTVQQVPTEDSTSVLADMRDRTASEPPGGDLRMRVTSNNTNSTERDSLLTSTNNNASSGPTGAPGTATTTSETYI